MTKMGVVQLGEWTTKMGQEVKRTQDRHQEEEEEVRAFIRRRLQPTP
jgi:hypothetical protein